MVAVKKVCRKPGSVLLAVVTGTTLPLGVTIIYLGRTLLGGSSDQPGRASGKGCFARKLRPIRSCSRWGLPGTKSPAFLGVSYTSVPSLPDPQLLAAIGGPFLWHYPSARADWTLSSTLPYGARTFLPRQQGRRRLSVKLSKATHVSIQASSMNHKYETVGKQNICYIKRNGSVSTFEACTFVSYFPSFNLVSSQSATFAFINFSAL